MVGETIFGLLSVLMKKTQAMWWLCLVCEALFGSCIFGIEATKVVLAEVYKKHIFSDHQSLLAVWKLLRAIDTSAVGGLNYNGIETLQSVEGLMKYQHGVLPLWSSVQRCAYKLNEVGQHLIRFEKKACNLGEMYPYGFEKFLCFILKVFQLDGIAQRESIELYNTGWGWALWWHLSLDSRNQSDRSLSCGSKRWWPSLFE